ncbi:hypothetical protein [Paenibacillus sp. Root444D2]|uniref:hypothetical protein n=1 Tax=Paenibacillus sp. Root444D2 TaxID=1736538 RepID=UPI000AE4EC66|nr:hypothetical protein [Paenibacillus sp. Root444D2]
MHNIRHAAMTAEQGIACPAPEQAIAMMASIIGLTAACNILLLSYCGLCFSPVTMQQHHPTNYVPYGKIADGQRLVAHYPGGGEPLSAGR